MMVIGYALINFAQDQLAQPVVMGSEFNLSPLVVFIAVVVWVWILRPAGVEPQSGMREALKPDHRPWAAPSRSLGPPSRYRSTPVIDVVRPVSWLLAPLLDRP